MPAKGQHRAVDQLVVDTICQEYARGATLNALIKSYGIDFYSLKRLLTDLGVRIRTREEVVADLPQNNPGYRKGTAETSARAAKASQARWARPGSHERQSVALTQAWLDPGLRAEQSRKSSKRQADPEYKARSSATGKALWEDPEYVERQHAALMASRDPEEWAESNRKISREYWAKPESREIRGQQTRELWQTEEYRENRRAGREHLLNDPDYLAYMRERIIAGWASPEVRQRASDRMKQVWASLSPEARSQWIRNFLAAVEGPTYIEFAIRAVLNENGFHDATGTSDPTGRYYLTNEPVDGYYGIDILIPWLKLAIECDGCHWHNCPEHDPNGNPGQTAWDRQKNGFLKSRRHFVARMWEHEINDKGPKQALLDALPQALREQIFLNLAEIV